MSDFNHARQEALDAAREVIDAQIQNVLGRNLAWRAVQAALDKYDDEWALWLYAAGHRQAFAVMSNGKPVAIVPTRRMARQHRRMLIRISGGKDRSYHVVSTSTYSLR